MARVAQQFEIRRGEDALLIRQAKDGDRREVRRHRIADRGKGRLSSWLSIAEEEPPWLKLAIVPPALPFTR